MTNGAAAGSWRAVGRLPDGPLDFVGDVHGELEALRALMSALGYDAGGRHAAGRRLVFLGDFVDRGPDSPGVVRTVGDLVDSGRALAVMGNHDLNAVAGLLKPDNVWLYGHGEANASERRVESERERAELLAVLRSLPVALAREDVRAVHACWDGASLEALSGAAGAAEAMREHKARITARFGEARTPEAELALQNENPVKVVTSGPEEIAAEPYFGAGKWRTQRRRRWWEEYRDSAAVVFGHYWRIEFKKNLAVFDGYAPDEWLGPGRAMCVDYSVGWRATERRNGKPNGPYAARLAALRWPECELVFDDGERRAVVSRRR